MIVKLTDQRTKRLLDHLELAWGIIANAGAGEWKNESKLWQDAAAEWRKEYFSILKEAKK